MPKFVPESRYLSAHVEIPPERDTIVKIINYKRGVVGQGNNAREGWVIYFEGFTKGLILNSTNGKTITTALGTDEMSEWVGRRIALYVKPDVEIGGEIKPGIRVRPVSADNGAAPANPALDDLLFKVALAQNPGELLQLKSEAVNLELGLHEMRSFRTACEKRAGEFHKTFPAAS